MADLRGIPLLPLGSGELEVEGVEGFTAETRYPLLGLVVDSEPAQPLVRVLTTDDDHRLRHVASASVRVYRPVLAPRRARTPSAGE